MTKTEAKERIEKLKDLVNYHRYLYHVLDRQEISDAALDSLKHELSKLESEYPEYLTPDSPTQRAGKPLSGFKKVRHGSPMLSLQDAFAEEEMKAWEGRITKLVPSEKLDYFAELKIDGFAISLVYEDGFLAEGSTRGDGYIGEDVTQNLKTIESIPLKLNNVSGINTKQRIEVRGEVFMSEQEFERVNKEQTLKNLPFYANPRNLAAGSIRQLDPKIAASRRLDSYFYNLVTDLGQKTHEDEHKILADLGFKTSPHVKYCPDLLCVLDYYDYWTTRKGKLPFEVDGMVAIVNSLELERRLGMVGKAPRWAVAYKFPAEQATTGVLDIQIGIGRTGALTPVAILEPVLVAGSTVSRATLHNEDEIKRKDIRIGDTVIIQKAGDVIPEVVESLKNLRTGKEKYFKMPKECPICGGKVIRPEGEAVARCANTACFAIRREQIIHFVSRDAFDIQGLGEKIIDQLLARDLITDSADLFKLKAGDLQPLERFAEKSASNIIESIESHKKVTLAKFIFALGIRYVGIQTAALLADYFGNLEKIKDASIEELENVEGVGKKVAASIYNWFGDPNNLRYIKELKDAGVGYELHEKSYELEGMTFVITGSLSSMAREEAEEIIRNMGGKASSSVSKNTSYVVAGENPGSKHKKAIDLGIKIINENEFLKLLED